jgi:hypothetical protein
MSAVENDDAHSARDEFVEAPHDAGRVGERELGSRVAHRRNMSFVHAHNNSRGRASEEHRTFAHDRASPADSQRESAAVLARDLDNSRGRASEEHRTFAHDRASPADSQRESAAVLARDLDANLARPSHLDALTDREFSPRRRLD